MNSTPLSVYFNLFLSRVMFIAALKIFENFALYQMLCSKCCSAGPNPPGASADARGRDQPPVRLPQSRPGSISGGSNTAVCASSAVKTSSYPLPPCHSTILRCAASLIPAPSCSLRACHLWNGRVLSASQSIVKKICYRQRFRSFFFFGRFRWTGIRITGLRYFSLGDRDGKKAWMNPAI